MKSPADASSSWAKSVSFKAVLRRHISHFSRPARGVGWDWVEEGPGTRFGPAPKWIRDTVSFSRTSSTTTKIVFQADAAELQETSCSCTAGKVLCNHLVALLFQSAHYSMLQVRAVPPPVACTSSLQTWHRPRTKDPSQTRKSCLLGKD
ncbi:hypothetical protein PFLUV_G00182730 [Perca fluviatilis]|uniref:SWIM-type domain-containing protein n=1 Tax=Perca fluviatilis TaxID=8168 RepID=A0A6A5DX61_PERFL|nr:hypothetical protein PFLUV_G00182730 [Perca fluviatilis]